MKNRLAEIRKQNEISQDELAEVLKVSRQTISSIENGRYNPSITLAFRISHFFKMEIKEIFIYEGED
jgi:putative transcriptional regulator